MVREPLRLMPALEERGAEMDVVEVQRAALGGDVDALHAALFTGLPREIVLDVLGDRQPAQDRVAELVAAQLARRRHHPPHPEQRPELLRMAPVVRSGADDFLQRDDVGVDRAEDRGDPLRARAAVEAAAAMNVVGRDAQRRARPLSHYAMIARGDAHAGSRSARDAAVLLLALAALGAAGCTKVPEDPLKLERNMLTVSNQSSNDWTNVEVWLNTYYRVTTSSVRAGSRFQAPLDTFVAGFGQRFDFHRMQVRDLRLTAKLPDGTPFELKKQFEVGGLAGALGGRR